LNMPATSIRDLVVKDNDLVVGTHGRSFWILDDISPLRQLTPEVMAKPVILYGPAPSYRVRWNMNPDTPLPPEEPVGQNPPDGAVIDYYLKEKAEDVWLEIYSPEGKLVRRYSNHDTLYKIPDVNIPLYWIRPQQILSGEAGAHRFLWDMHYAPLNVPPNYPISAMYQNTAPEYTSPWMTPGIYTVRLRAGNTEVVQSFYLVMDPRVKTSLADLRQQYDLSMKCYEQKKKVLLATASLNKLQNEITLLLPKANDSLVVELKDISKRLAALQAAPKGSKNPSMNSIGETADGLFNALQAADVPPTSQCEKAVNQLYITFQQLGMKWDILNEDMGKLNRKLVDAGLAPLKLR
jgi:hypothetical protein